MNITNQLPAPLNSFVIDIEANHYYDFELPPDSSYPLKGVTYPVDYGHIQGYITEDGKELDLFVGSQLTGTVGYVIVDRGGVSPSEHKFYVGLSDKEVTAVIEQLKPVLISAGTFKDIPALVHAVERDKDN